jgi:hypothetical protein
MQSHRSCLSEGVHREWRGVEGEDLVEGEGRGISMSSVICSWRFYSNGGIGRERGVFLLKLCWDGGKDETTACVSKNALVSEGGDRKWMGVDGEDLVEG